MSHVTARPMYRKPRRCHDSRNDDVRNTRSYSNTISGADTMTSLLPIPSAQETMAATYHTPGRLDSEPRRVQYNVSNRNSPINNSVRWTRYVTLSVCSGCTTQISAL